MPRLFLDCVGMSRGILLRQSKNVDGGTVAAVSSDVVNRESWPMVTSRAGKNSKLLQVGVCIDMCSMFWKLKKAKSRTRTNAVVELEMVECSL